MGTAFLYGNGGSGGTGATLTVTAPSGCTVTVSKDGKSKTKVAGTDGVAVFKGLATGTWTVTITDGEQTAQKTFAVTADYSTDITFFSAQLTIRYWPGYQISATFGGQTIMAPDTSGLWDLDVTTKGTVTVTATYGDDVVSSDISVTDVKPYSMSMCYLYYHGKEISVITGGWDAYAWRLTTSTFGEKPRLTKNYDNLYIQSPPEWGGVVRTINKIDLAGFSRITMIGEMTAGGGNKGYLPMSAWPNISSTFKTDPAVIYYMPNNTDIFTNPTLDVSTVSTPCYIGFGSYDSTQTPNYYVRMYGMLLE